MVSPSFPSACSLGFPCVKEKFLFYFIFKDRDYFFAAFFPSSFSFGNRIRMMVKVRLRLRRPEQFIASRNYENAFDFIID